MTSDHVEREALWNSERVTVCLLIGILLLAWSLRLTGLGAKSLWQDEIFTAAIASTENSVSQVAAIPLYNTALPAPPLYFLITHVFLHIGDNDFLLRFSALVFGVLGVATTYAVGARLFGKRAGLIGAFLLSLAPLHIRYSQEARFYTLLVFLSLLSLYFLYRGIFERQTRWWTAFTLCSILNVYNHLFAFLVLLAETVFLAGLWVAEALISDRRARRAKGEMDLGALGTPADKRVVLAFVGSLAIIALAYAPMTPHLLRGLSGGKGLGGAPRGMDFMSSLMVQALDSWGLGSGWAILILLVPFLIGIIVSVTDQRRQLWLAFCWLVVPFAVLFAFPARHGFRPRYVLFMLPLYLLFVARGLTAIDDLFAGWLAGRRARLRNMSLAVILGGVALLSVPAAQSYCREDRGNWRAVASLLGAGLSPDDVIVSPGPFPQVVLPRYEERLEEAVFMIGGSDEFLLPDREQEGGVWFVGPAGEKMRSVDSELTEALRLFFKVIFEVDDDTAARGRALKMAPAMYDDLWVIYVKEGLALDGVLQLYEEALASVPPSTASSIHVTLGDLYRVGNELDQAAVHYQQAAMLDPFAPGPHYGLALVYEAQGLHEQYASEWETYEELAAR